MGLTAIQSKWDNKVQDLEMGQAEYLEDRGEGIWMDGNSFIRRALRATHQEVSESEPPH